MGPGFQPHLPTAAWHAPCAPPAPRPPLLQPTRFYPNQQRDPPARPRATSPHCPRRGPPATPGVRPPADLPPQVPAVHRPTPRPAAAPGARAPTRRGAARRHRWPWRRAALRGPIGGPAPPGALAAHSRAHPPRAPRLPRRQSPASVRRCPSSPPPRPSASWPRPFSPRPPGQLGHPPTRARRKCRRPRRRRSRRGAARASCWQWRPEAASTCWISSHTLRAPS
mmetsp:Transcript_102725/g.329352  ORF Transcript_102725/g.329352 Transcript_102725/m.329352 type:complete len:224 (-) Transcript_102725:821-1492(-)